MLRTTNCQFSSVQFSVGDEDRPLGDSSVL